MKPSTLVGGEARVVPLGDAACRRDVSGPIEAQDLVTSIRRSLDADPFSGVRDVLAGWSCVVVTFDPTVADMHEVGALLAHEVPAKGLRAPPRVHVIPTSLDGPDVAWVCATAGLTSTELTALLVDTELRVAMVGFSPGFGYLDGLPDPLRDLPRRSTPRVRVPAGSFALGGGFAAYYPQATPGGWQLIGSTRTRLFDVTTPPFSVLSPGDVVRIDVVPSEVDGRKESHPVGKSAEPTTHEPGVTSSRKSDGLQSGPPFGAARFRVEKPGTFSVVQDGGRAGWAHLGVPSAGPMDPVSHGLSNLLVGNDRGAPAIETVGGGLVLRAITPTFVAVTGPGAVISIDDRDVLAERVTPIDANQVLEIRDPAGGLRSYVAWPGGVGVPPVFTSFATDVLSWTGPGALKQGQVLGTAGPSRRMAAHLRDSFAPVRTRTEPDVIRVLPGPHANWFSEGTLEKLGEMTFRVDGASDRVGVRMRPVEGPGLPRRSGELASEPMVTGAVQVPPDGMPIVLGPDHATLGGYPVLAVVISADQWRLGQARPGDFVRFNPVTDDTATEARRHLDRAMEDSVVGKYPTVAG